MVANKREDLRRKMAEGRTAGKVRQRYSVQVRIGSHTELRRDLWRRVNYVTEVSGEAKWKYEDISFEYDATGYIKVPKEPGVKIVARDAKTEKWILVDPDSVVEYVYEEE